MSEPAPDLGALLGEITWLKSLAAGLVREPGRADDVVQDVLVAALERRPAAGRSLRPWLATVARRLALKGRRDAATRERVLPAVQRRESEPSAAELVERVDLERRLAEAVLALDEPYREAVILQYHEGLAPAGVARRLGLRPEAARQRVSRGLAMLRARLDRSFEGGRGTWCALLTARLLPPEALATGPVTGGASLIGGLAVTTKVWFSLAAAAALLGSLWWIGSGRASAPAGSGAAVAAADGEEDPGATENPLALAGAPPAEVEGNAERRALDEPVPEVELPPGSMLEVRFLGPDREPLHASGTAYLEYVTSDGVDTLEEVEVVVGRLECALEPIRRVEVHTRLPGFLPTSAPFELDLEPGERASFEMVLKPGKTIRGTVLDARTRRPLAGAFVWTEIFGLELPEDTPRAFTDELGRFELLGVAPTWRLPGQPPTVSERFYAVEASLEGYAFVPAHRLVWKQHPRADTGGVVEVEILLVSAPARLVGRVIAPGDAAPGPAVAVHARDADQNVFITGADPESGRFEFPGLPAGPVSLVVVPHEEYGARRAVAVLELKLRGGETREVELELQPANCVVEGRVLDGEGRPVADVRVHAESWVETAGGTEHLRAVDARTGSDGRFSIEELHPGALTLRITDHGRRPELAYHPPSLRMDLGPAEWRTGVDFTGRAGVVFSGCLEPWPEGGLEERVLLRAELPDGRDAVALFVSDDGRFMLPGIYPTGYRLVARLGQRVIGELAVGPDGASDLVVPIAP